MPNLRIIGNKIVIELTGKVDDVAIVSAARQVFCLIHSNIAGDFVIDFSHATEFTTLAFVELAELILRVRQSGKCIVLRKLPRRTLATIADRLLQEFVEPELATAIKQFASQTDNRFRISAEIPTSMN